MTIPLIALSAALFTACAVLSGLLLARRPRREQEALRLLLLDSLLETMPIGVFMVQAPSGKPLLANAHAKRLLGRGILPDADRRNLQEVYEAYRLGTEERYPVDRMPIIRGMSGERSRVSDMKVLRPDGSFSVLDVFGSPILDRSGSVVASLVVFFDITDRLSMRDALFRKAEELDHFFSSSLDLLCIADTDGTFLRLNPAWEEILGYPPQEMEGRKFLEFVHPEDVESTLESIKVLSEQREILNFVNRYRHRDGSWRYIEWRSAPSGRLIYAAARDITERIHAEEEREKLRDQLNQARKIEALGRLAGGVAHDFNNMLGAILGYAELSEALVEPGSKVGANLREIVKAASRSADLTRQLLAFARRQSVHPRTMDLGKALSSMADLLSRLMGEGVSLDLCLPEEDLRIRFDPSQLDQIMVNLCANARDAMGGKGGRVRISAEERLIEKSAIPAVEGASAGSWALISVSDQGSGMDGATLSRLFEPFFTTKALHKGTGLGLATVHGIVRQNGGFIEVSSRPGEGSEFRVHLPLATEAGAEEPPPLAPPAFPAKGERILLVEDEASLLSLTRQMLEGLGYAVLAAAGPEEALALAAESGGRIDLLLTDIVMPGVNGMELARRIVEERPDLPCLFMSGYTSEGIDPSALNAAGRLFIQKPFSLSVLGTALRQLLDRGQVASAREQ